MGGSIAVTLREPNGTVHKKGVWTNPLPDILKDIRVHRKDMNYLRKELLDWKTEGKYFHSDLLAPLEYGLIVIDLQTNHFIECNNYSYFDCMNGVALSNDMSASHKGSYGYTLRSGERYYENAKDAFYDDEHEGPCAKLRPWLWEGRVKAFKWNREKQEQELFHEKPTIEEIIKWEDKKDSDGMPFLSNLQFSLDWSPEWTYISYRRENFKKLQVKIEELGFVLTDEEKKEWNDYLKEE